MRGHGRRDPKGGNARGDPRVGGALTPQRKTRIYLTSPLNMRTCCCGKSMETSFATMTVRTCTGECRQCFMKALLAPSSRAIG